MYNIEKTCCCTGHRPKGLPWQFNLNSKAYNDFLAEFELEITNIIQNGYAHFICGMALGIDLIFAEIIINLRDFKNKKITLECAVPCPNQTRNWSVEDINRYERVIEKADSVKLISNSYTSFCMMKRNEYMVSNSKLVLAVWNGVEKGGTWQTIKYANRLKKDLKIIKV